jgi:cystathionine beta-lyase
MAQHEGLNRRAFLKSAGMTALVGATGTGASLATTTAEAAFQASTGPFDFDTPYNRIGTDSTKWDSALRAIKLSGGDNIVAGMGIADMDFKCAPAITKALMARIQHENWGYEVTPSTFAEGIISWNKRRHGIDINPDLLGITTGIQPGLIAALKAFSPAGSKVLLLTPSYNGFYGDLTASGTLPEESPLKYANGRFSIDFEDLERRISRETHSLILCNPNNPTGNVWSREDLTTLGGICLKRRVVVLADEVHCDFVNKGQKYVPFASLENRDIVNNSVTFKAASKSFGLAVMKCAWFFTTNPGYFAAVRANNRADLNSLGMLASKAAYAGGEDWLNQVNVYIDGNHDFVQSYFKANIPLIPVGQKPEGTYLVWLDVSRVAEKIGAKQMAAETNKNRGTGMGNPVTPETMVQRWFEKNAGVQINAGSSYGIGGADHMRMNIGTSRKTLEKALASMAAALKRGSSAGAAI